MKYNKNMRNEQGVYNVIINDGDTMYCYLGSGFLYDRVSGNCSKLHRGVHSNKALQDAYNRTKNCKVEVLEVCDGMKEARIAENEYIKHFSRIDDVVVCNKYPAVVNQKPYKRMLDENKVKEIKVLLADGKRIKDVAVLYGVSGTLISRIKHGVRWGSVVI